MLDKSVPYAGVYMRREKGAPVPEYPLPNGYHFSFYTNGTEKDWARIETSVLEFDSEFESIFYYTKKFLPEREQLYGRCLFAETEAGEKIATATAWWDTIDDEALPWLQWVAVMPEHQGRGIGLALVSRITKLMLELEGDSIFYLHTQTWSHKAIEIYKLMGYDITNEKKLYRSTNDNYRKAARILKKLRKDNSK